MAIYHLSAKVISRSSGRSSTASTAYRSGEKIKDERTGLTFDYSQKKGIDASLILTPDNAPDWMNNRSRLWNEVEKSEKRKDSQLAREIEVAIPVELSNSQKQELVREFVSEQFVNRGMVADIAFHHLNSHNPHAHILLTMRDITDDGFGQKNRDWNRKELLVEFRSAWETQVNQALEQAGTSARIDHRSLEAQGINRIPQIHLGANVTAMMKRGIATERGDTYLGIRVANQEIEQLEIELKVTEELIEYEPRKTQQNQARQNLACDTASINFINNQLITLEEEEEEGEKDKQENFSFGLELAQYDSQTTENFTTNQLSDAQLINLEEQWSHWEKENEIQTYLKSRQGKKISQQFQQLQLDQTKLTKALAAQKRQLAQLSPRSLFNPWGDSPKVIKKQQQKLKRTQSRLKNLHRQLNQAHFQLKQWEKDYQTWFNNPDNQKMREYGKQRVTPEISSRIETLLEGYSIHKAAEYILDVKGKLENKICCVEGNNYRISRQGKTITIMNKHSGELIYLGTDETDNRGIIEVKQFQLSQDDKKAITETAQHLIKEQEKVNCRGIER